MEVLLERVETLEMICIGNSMNTNSKSSCFYERLKALRTQCHTIQSQIELYSTFHTQYDNYKHIMKSNAITPSEETTVCHQHILLAQYGNDDDEQWKEYERLQKLMKTVPLEMEMDGKSISDLHRLETKQASLNAKGETLHLQVKVLLTSYHNLMEAMSKYFMQQSSFIHNESQ